MEDSVTLINRIPREGCVCVNVKSGTRLIAVLGVLIGISCAAVILMQGRKQLTIVDVLLTTFLILFVAITVSFIIVSIFICKAAIEENPTLVSYYIWLAIMYLSAQLILALVIPVLFVIDGKYHTSMAVIWMAIVVVVILGWSHFISVVSSYRMSLL